MGKMHPVVTPERRTQTFYGFLKFQNAILLYKVHSGIICEQILVHKFHSMLQNWF